MTDLAAKVLRVFLGWPGVTLLPEGGGSYDFAKRYVEGRASGFFGRTNMGLVPYEPDGGRQTRWRFRRHLVLQNHPPVIGRGYGDCLNGSILKRDFRTQPTESGQAPLSPPC